MWIQREAETLGYLKTMCPQEMRAKIDPMIEKFLVQPRISKTVKNEWTLRNGNALNNCIFRARKCPGVGKVLGECFCSWLCLSVFAAETPRDDSGNEPASPENTVYAQVTHPNMVSPFSLILHRERYCYSHDSKTCHHSHLTNPNDVHHWGEEKATESYKALRRPIPAPTALTPTECLLTP